MVMNTKADFPEVVEFFGGLDMHEQHLLFESWSSRLISESTELSPVLPFDLWNLQEQLATFLNMGVTLNAMLTEECVANLEMFKLALPIMDIDHFHYLSAEEYKDPFKTLKAIFAEVSFHEVLLQLDFCMWEGLFIPYEDLLKELQNVESLLKKLMLIGHWTALLDTIKRGYPDFDKPVNSCTSSSEIQHPYTILEEFFHGMTLGSYRGILRDWMRSASSIERSLDNPVQILYFKEKLIKVLKAAFIVGKFRVKYEPSRLYYGQRKPFREWIVQVRQQQVESFSSIQADFELVCLEKSYQDRPLEYLRKTLTLDRIQNICKGLDYWLEAALDKSDDLDDVKENFKFSLFDDLEQLMEAIFATIAGIPSSPVNL